MATAHGHKDCACEAHGAKAATAPPAALPSGRAGYQIVPAVLHGETVSAERHDHDHEQHEGGSTAAPADDSPVEQLFQCAKNNNLARFQHLLTLYGPEIALGRDAQGHTAAHWAAQRCSGEFVEYVHSIGAPMDLPSTDKVQLHPIHWASSSGNLEALRALVRLGIDVNTADVAKHRTPLLLAAQNGFPLLVLFLVQNGADVNLVDVDGDSAIHWAAYKGATEIVSVFQYLGLSSDSPDRFGQTPLHLAAMRGELATVQYLVEELDADMTVKDRSGRTPLELAKRKGYRPVERYLTKQAFRHKWNLLALWEASRAPYYFVLANAVLSVVLYALALMPRYPELWGFFVPHLAWNTVTWVFFVLTVRTNPGDVSKDARCQQEYTDVTNALISGDDKGKHESVSPSLDRPLCHTCHVQRPLRAKHCRVCKTCVRLFDHHCPFVDNCVGRDNYVVFMAFLAFLIADIAAVHYLLYRLWLLHGLRVWMVFCAVYLAGLQLPVVNLFGVHLYLTARNLTTNEAMNSHRYQYMRSAVGGYRNPFDRGVVRNFSERCLPAFAALDQEDKARGRANPAQLV